jgi:hypothetical protein
MLAPQGRTPVRRRGGVVRHELAHTGGGTGFDANTTEVLFGLYAVPGPGRRGHGTGGTRAVLSPRR